MVRFFDARGITPASVDSDADAPILDADGTTWAEEDTEVATAPIAELSITQQIQQMTMVQRVRAAMKGTREMRAILVRDPNKLVASAVLSSPKLAMAEVEAFAKMATVGEDVLRAIALNRAWVKNYAVALGLARNPKTPVALSLTCCTAWSIATSRRSPSIGTCPSRCAWRRAGRCGVSALTAAPPWRAWSGRRRDPPFRAHLRQPVHEHGRPLALLVAGHLLQQVDGPGEILQNGLLGRRVVQATDLGHRVVGRGHGWPPGPRPSTRTPSSSIEASRISAPVCCQRRRMSVVRSGGARQNRQPPPPAPQTLPAQAPAAPAAASSASMMVVVTPGASRVRARHSSASDAPAAAQSWRSSAARRPAAAVTMRVEAAVTCGSPSMRRLVISQLLIPELRGAPV